MIPSPPNSGPPSNVSRVQWVTPIRAIPPKGKLRQRQVRDTHSPSSSFTSHQSFNVSNPNYVSKSDTNESDNKETATINEDVCKTICVIVEEYIKELREHQRCINNARSSIREPQQTAHNLINEQQTASNMCISLNDISRLKVRDEQTKAVGTIQRLTNYLRELTNLQKTAEQLTPTAGAVISDNICERLSDVRNEIVQALNDFVLTNGDIDVPLADPEDPNDVGRDYDLLMDAKDSNPDGKKSNNSNGPKEQYNSADSDSEKVVKLATRRRLPLTSSYCENSGSTMATSTEIITSKEESMMEISRNDQMDKRKREIMKLEKDTVELRRLFADFYQLVKAQSESLDSIESNIMITAASLNEANHHLSHASNRHKTLTILVPVTGCVTGALIGGPIGLIIGGKLGGLTMLCASSLVGLFSSMGVQKCIKP